MPSLFMREDTMQVIAALVLVNLLAWGTYVYLQEETTNEYIIANVSVTIDYNGAEDSATKNTNITIVTYNVTVVNDTSAFNATLEAGKSNFEVIVTWHEMFGAFIKEIDGVSNSDGIYWILYHNGERSEEGATSLKLQEGDTITWKYESY